MLKKPYKLICLFLIINTLCVQRYRSDILKPTKLEFTTYNFEQKSINCRTAIPR